MVGGQGPLAKLRQQQAQQQALQAAAAQMGV